MSITMGAERFGTKVKCSALAAALDYPSSAT